MLRNVFRPDSARVAGTREKSQLHDLCPAPDIVRRMGRAGRGGGTTKLYTYFTRFSENREKRLSVSSYLSVCPFVHLCAHPDGTTRLSLDGFP